MKKFIISLFIFFFIVFSLFGIAYLNFSEIIRHPLKITSSIVVHVKTGDNLYSVLKNLNSNGEVGNMSVIKLYIKNNNLNTNIKPGTYSFSKDISLKQLISDLNKGNVDTDFILVTIPEGYTIEKIADKLAEKGILDKTTFLEDCQKYILPPSIKPIPNRKYALEGYMFPDSYELKKGMTGQVIIKKMLDRFDQVVAGLEKDNNLIFEQDKIDNIVTLASIVEGEAIVKDERSVIAGVFNNRLKSGMKLQSCATVEYILGVHKLVLSYKDIAIISPYNTYLNTGLPVGPIGNPGKASLLAAMKPETTKYLYFVAKFDGSNSHFFSENLSLHNQAVKVSEANRKKNGY
ncbi:MAG TPA: endolytic transglycosylase MltG [Clostridiaceae bacterium]